MSVERVDYLTEDEYRQALQAEAEMYENWAAEEEARKMEPKAMSYRPEGVKVEHHFKLPCDPYTYTKYLTGYDGAELSAMDAAVEAIKQDRDNWKVDAEDIKCLYRAAKKEVEAKDKEIERLKEKSDRADWAEVRVKVLTECLNGSSKATYTAELFDEQRDRADKAEQRIRELEEENARYKALWNGPGKAAMGVAMKARADALEEMRPEVMNIIRGFERTARERGEEKLGDVLMRIQMVVSDRIRALKEK